MLRAAARSLNLTAALAFVAVAELLFNRLLGKLFLPQHPTAPVGRLLAATGRFAFHLGGVLGLVLLTSAIVGAFRRRELFPRSMRVTMGLIGALFVVLAAVGVVFAPLAEQWAIVVKISHAFLAWFMAMALWRSTLALRTKFGVTLFALPAVLDVASVFARRVGVARPVPEDFARAAEVCALLAAAASPFLLALTPLHKGRRLAGVASGTVVLAVVVAAFLLSFDLLHTVALYGFGIDLPPPASAAAGANAALVVAAFAGLAVSVVWTLTASGPARLFGYGLILLATAGYQVMTPHHIVLSLCGLLAIVFAARRLALSGLSEPQPAV